MAVTNENLLGTYLKDRRAKLDPTELGRLWRDNEDAERIRALLRSQTLPSASQTAVAAHERQ